MHGTGKTVCGTISDTDGVFFSLELGNRADGTEDLLLHDLHVFTDAGEYCRLNEVTFLAMALTAGFHFGTGFLALFNVSALIVSTVVAIECQLVEY